MKNSFHPSSEEKELLKAILLLEDEQGVSNFFRDLLTLPEIKEFGNRFQMAKLLYEGKPYLEVAKLTHSSTTTVARVAHWLKNGMGGYKKVLEKLFAIEEKENSLKDLTNKKYITELSRISNEFKSGKGKPAKKNFKELKI